MANPRAAVTLAAMAVLVAACCSVMPVAATPGMQVQGAGVSAEGEGRRHHASPATQSQAVPPAAGEGEAGEHVWYHDHDAEVGEFMAGMLLETGVEMAEDGSLTALPMEGEGEDAAFVEMAATMGAGAQAEKVHGYCEICTRMVQMYQRGLPDLCTGLTDTFFITCVKNMESLLKADRAVVYWHQVGCVHMDDGPEIVKPCPAHTICGWTPNIFARRTGVTQTMGQVAPLCPRDVNFLPRVPRTLAPGGLPGT